MPNCSRYVPNGWDTGANEHYRSFIAGAKWQSSLPSKSEQIGSEREGEGKEQEVWEGITETIKSDLANAIELQEQEQDEQYNRGREAGLKYALEMISKHFTLTRK